MPGPQKAPLEQRRRTGRSPGRDSGGRKLPDPGKVVALRGVDGEAPKAPSTLAPGKAGEIRWTRIWREATWLSPATDGEVVTRLCEAEQLREAMRAALADEGFYVKGSQGQLRPNPLLNQIRATESQILQLERECGLTPSSRGSLGVGEVKNPDDDNPLLTILRRAAGRGPDGKTTRGA